ncbi:F-box/WD repeat-containing protein pof10 [Podospora aff. communis PSN243]|uniref:F-box/WD repeat-containing protein pof10 n=1 Tax=Podospora aff. communis PSN243 TaxID=3040156 RepID=A0AAV9GQ31_9PEZI|nr:F-box/WD repeat-containing protein pof10 [Podospora aff. communis PSN243]
MQHGLTETSQRESPANRTYASSTHSSQHGSPRLPPGLPDARRQPYSRSVSPGSQRSSADGDDVDIGQLDRKLGRLSVAGQRIRDYETAAASSALRQSPRPALGFKVIKRPGTPSDGVQLTDFPNEILTHIISHLHPDSQGTVALVSKRFYALVTTPYAWRTAFLRYFPGHDALAVSKTSGATSEDAEGSDEIRSEARYFTRLTSLASWRSEYLLRTRLLRSVARGKPGDGGTFARSGQAGKKAGAVLTYNSKLPWMVSNIHASFSGGKKGPRAIHGTADLCVSTVSDPTTGKIEKFGLDDPFSFAQLDEMFPNLEPFGVGEGPAAVPNVLDVSQPYGMIGGEGFPGGRVYFRAIGELRGRYLGHDSAIIDMAPEIPKIPQLTESICSVWIAKSSNVPFMTQSMVGMLSGSSLGVVTSYALGSDSTGPRFSHGDMTACWVLSPGVPIVDIKVDESYNQKRKSLGRIWAVALNALGEVYYLTTTPTPPLARAKPENVLREAWSAGRTAYWELIESTRRTARPDEFDKNATRGAYSPRSPGNSTHLSKEQTIAESREIEKFLRHTPAYFRYVCQGWDMRRNLEVDFAGGDETGVGEGIFIVTCGHEKGETASVRRYVRGATKTITTPAPEAPLVTQPHAGASTSIFGGLGIVDTAPVKNETAPAAPQPDAEALEDDGWCFSEYSLKSLGNAEITTSAVDMSTFATLAAFEDPLHAGSQVTVSNPHSTPTSKNSTGELPGRRARLLAVGTSNGAVVAWNMRDTLTSPAVIPVRAIQTDSPEVTCLAVSALYLVHGGSDGLVQAWDPLASSPEPIRTLSAKSSGRIPRHILHANPALEDANYFAVRAIFLDPDPTSLRGILSFGTFLRFWTYSSSGQSSGRKRRVRHSDIHGRLASRRNGGAVSSYIAAEEAELRHEQENRSRELARLQKRFGVGLGDLTEEEAIRYAQMISEEAFLQDEQRRLSASDTGSAADFGDTASSTGSIDTVTPEPSLSGASSGAPSLPPLQEETDDDYEAQIQRAIRLSLLEGVNDAGQSPRGQSSGEYDFQVKVKTKSKDKKKGKGSSSASPTASTPMVPYGEPSQALGSGSGLGADADEDLALALRLSLEEEEARQNRASQAAALDSAFDEYPPLEFKGKGKGKGV